MYERTFQKAVALARQVCRNAETAQDIVQSAAEYAIGRERVTESYWLQLVRNRAIGYMRDNRPRRYEVAIGGTDSMAEHEAGVIKRTLRRRNVG